MDILFKSLCVNFFPEHNISIGVLADRITRLVGQNVNRIDDIHGSNGQHYCFVHFDKDMPEILWDALSNNSEIFDTPEGPIRVGLNETNGLDPETKDEIIQYSLTDTGLYSRDFKTNHVRKWNVSLMSWVATTENPFVPAVNPSNKRREEPVSV